MSEKRVKPRFNIVDVLILVLLVAVLWVFAMYANIGGSTDAGVDGTETSTVQYTVEIKGIREENLNAFAEGDEISGEKGSSIGKIISVGEYAKETVLTEDEKLNKYVVTEIPNKYTVKLVIESPCEKYNNKMVVDAAYPIKVGKKINIKTNKYVSTSTILEVKES